MTRHRHHLHHLHRFLLLFALPLIACRPAESTGSLAATLDTEVVLAPAQEAVFDQQGLEIQFVSVVEDSRCPVDTTCVWAGQVIVRLAIHSAAGGESQHDVPAGESVTIDNHRVSVVKVTPEPVSTRKISPEDYRVTIEVARR